MVTHDQAEALAIADRIAVMRAGRLLQVGTPREIYDAPADPFTAGFVGAINLLPATAESADTIRILGRVPLSLRHGFAPGAKVLAAIRPEFIALDPARGALAATVAGREFQGAFVRLSLAVEGLDQPLLADVGNADALAADGGRVTVGFAPRHVRLFADAP